MCDVNRIFSPLATSAARSRIFGRRRSRAPIPVWTFRSGPCPVPNDALPAIRKPLFGEPVEEGLDLHLERGREHPARAFPGDPGERVLDRTRLAQRDDADIVLHQAYRSFWRFWQARHPPRYAALSTRITQVRP
jgi:hypothetical protein